MNHIGTYKIERFPASRLATIDIGIISHNRNSIKALIELDVTDARSMIREKKKNNEDISFNAWLIYCISKTVEQNKAIHAIRKGKQNIVVFNDVDISIMIEKTLEGKKVPLPYVIRKANEKSIAAITEEIRAAQKQSIINEGNYVLGEMKNKYLMKFYYRLPAFLRRGVWGKMLHNPFITKQNMGTVMITSVGMMGKINGWVIPESIHPLAFAVGSVIKKPGIKNNKIEIREYLNLTVSVDHDVIDGAPAIRALSKLINHIEKGYGL